MPTRRSSCAALAFVLAASMWSCADRRDGAGDEVAATGADGGGDATGGGGDDDARFDVEGGQGTAGDEGGGAFTSCEAAAEDESSIGCEFWAVDLPNAWDPSIWNPDDPIPQEMQFAVVVANASLAVSASVEVFLENVLIDSAVVEINDIHTFELPRNDIDPQQTSKGTAFRLVSDVPIAAYQFQPLDNTVAPYSNDASLLFPVHSYDTDYVAVTSAATGMNTTDNPNVPSNVGSFVSVVAVQDGTTVDVYPTAPTAGGPTKGIVIGAGEVFTIIGDGGGGEGQGNLSGTRVHASAPVAVFSGNVAGHEPVDVPGCCLDHLEHQLLPMSAWGDTYLAAPPPNYEGKLDESAVYRLVGAFDGTTLEYDPAAPPGAPTTLAAGETAELVTKQPFAVTANHPFFLVEYLQSNGTLGYGASVPGDPAMWVVPAVDQLQAKYVFLSPHGYAENFLTVVAPAGIGILVDGEQIQGQFRMTGKIDGKQYVHTHIPVSPGSHMVEAEAPVGIAVFGYDRDVSYAYPGGSGVKYIYPPPPPPQG